MVDLTPGHFSEFFQAVHGYEPFKWQKRLAQQVLGSGRWPNVIRVPTGCGKTSALDLAVFELALQAGRDPRERTAPRRICFVIDRRLVVDEVTEHARRIQRAVRSAAADPSAAPVLKAVGVRLRRLAAEGEGLLRLVRLRGGVYRDDGWAADPLTPTIIVSTVDQIGSRLLFRGYGVSRRNLVVHAGLLAFDTRIILDEAHLSNVFVDTLDLMRRYQGLGQKSPLPPDRIVTVIRMSATAKSTGTSFELSDEDRKDERLKPRLQAKKPATLIEVNVELITKKLRQEQPGKARELEIKNRRALVEEIVRQARRHAGGEGDDAAKRAQVIGVVVNRVATARQVFEELRKTDDGRKHDALLLTGRIRPFDRDELLERWLPRIQAGRQQEPEEPLFVVATQTAEVGANIDFDALVTEAAPLDALRQRFGRLDRLGKRHERGVPSLASIVVRSDHAKNSDDDPVYGSAIAETWKWLKSVASTTGKGGEKRLTVDFGINHLDEKLPKDANDMEKLLARSVESPILFAAHLDAWVQTYPQPEADPDVAPFLHGRADAPADVQVIWRADLDPEHSSSWPATVALMPPLTREALPVPIYEMRAWLRKTGGTDVADVEGVEAGPDEDTAKGTKGRLVIRWRGKDDVQVVAPDEVKPGDTIVVPASYGGCDKFGWDPSCTNAVKDIVEQCLMQLITSYPTDAFRRPKLRLRLHPKLLPPADGPTLVRLRARLNAAVTAARSESEDARSAVRRLLEMIGPLSCDAHFKAAVEALLNRWDCADLERYPQDDGVVVTASVRLVQPSLPEDETEHDEPEGDEASFTGRQVPLRQHLESVSHTARDFAKECGLDDKFIRTLEVAGRWHDQGKRDWRFQAWLRGSERLALAEEEPLAKSGRDVSRWKPSILFGYPRGARHEFVSVRLFEKADGEHTKGCIRDLAKFLIGTHHGFGRPFPPVVRDDSPVGVKLALDGKEFVASSDHRLHRLDSGWPELFWSLVRRFGWWGLAYLEALLITADRTVSAREQQANEASTETAA